MRPFFNSRTGKISQEARAVGTVPKPCAACDGMIVRRLRDTDAVWAKRRFCSMACGGRLGGRRKRKSIFERLWANVDVGSDTDCWQWTGKSKHLFGYGLLTGTLPNSQARLHGAHRVAYVSCHGPIPDGLFILHSCDNPLCCNPAHLQVGSQKQNMADRQKRGRATYNCGPRTSTNYVKFSDKELAQIQKDFAKMPKKKSGYAANGAMIKLAKKWGVSYTRLQRIRQQYANKPQQNLGPRI